MINQTFDLTNWTGLIYSMSRNWGKTQILIDRPVSHVNVEWVIAIQYNIMLCCVLLCCVCIFFHFSLSTVVVIHQILICHVWFSHTIINLVQTRLEDKHLQMITIQSVCWIMRYENVISIWSHSIPHTHSTFDRLMENGNDSRIVRRAFSATIDDDIDEVYARYMLWDRNSYVKNVRILGFSISNFDA